MYNPTFNHGPASDRSYTSNCIYVTRTIDNLQLLFFFKTWMDLKNGQWAYLNYIEV